MIFFNNFIGLLSVFLKPFASIFFFFMGLFFVATVPCIIRYIIGLRR